MRWRLPLAAVPISVTAILILAPTGSSASLPFSGAQGETIAGSCQSSDGTQEPVTFTDQGGPTRVHLLLDRTVVRPGEQVRLAPYNLSRRPISYGLATGAEAAETGRPLRGTAFAYELIGLSAEPGEVGPCATLDVPNTAPIGDYRAVLEGVDGARLKNLKAPFTIAGEPVDPGPYVRAGTRMVGPRVGRRYRERELNRAADRLFKIVVDEPSQNWGIGHRNDRHLDLQISELTVKGFARIDRVAKIPVRVLVASGP